MIRNPLCDTKKSCHTVPLSVQLVNLLEHKVVLQSTHSYYARETKLQRVGLCEADSNDVIPIATMLKAVNQALKLQN